jgi:Na+-translocating ferredoxin:NAD+ oxidoreductase RnfG subunit
MVYRNMLDLIELVSITAGSAILLGLIASIVVDRMKQKASGDREKAITAIDMKWNKVKVPVNSS